MEILAVDDDPLLLHTIKMVLEEQFGEIYTLEDPGSIPSILHQTDVKVILLDLNFAIGDDDGAEGLAWIKKIKDLKPHVSIIVLTAHGFLDVAVKSLKQGATDFLEKPFANEKLVATVQAALNLANSRQDLADVKSSRNLLAGQTNLAGQTIVAESGGMKKVMDTISKIANTEASVLITGEHGTGKEVIARFIHQQSERAAQPFILTDMSAITPGLFESTLFGHVKGSYTDANEDRVGLMEGANLGTLLLDEIGELPMHLQTKLLTALENREVHRVGEHRARAIDIRVISTSHKSIEQLQDTEHFRQDLLFRINTVHIELPPLRDRKEDIVPLINYYLEKFNRKYGKKIRPDGKLSKELYSYNWPGNVRELKNSIERMVIMDDASEVMNQTRTVQNEDNLYELEKRKIEEIIQRHSGNISRAAAELGIGRNTLYRKMKKYGL